VYFPLHPETPPEGRSLDTLFAGRAVDLEAMYQRMKRLMDGEGLPYGHRTHTYNSRLAQELAKWAETQPGGQAIPDRIYRAYFVDGANIGDVDVLVELAELAGLSADTARRVIEERTFRAAVDADWSLSARSNITGVPTFVIGPRAVVGAQPEAVLRQLVADADAAPRHAERP
jgi:predicted DsbA family dithiol-disulfide isomerase